MQITTKGKWMAEKHTKVKTKESWLKNVNPTCLNLYYQLLQPHPSSNYVSSAIFYSFSQPHKLKKNAVGAGNQKEHNGIRRLTRESYYCSIIKIPTYKESNSTKIHKQN